MALYKDMFCMINEPSTSLDIYHIAPRQKGTSVAGGMQESTPQNEGLLLAHQVRLPSEFDGCTFHIKTWEERGLIFVLKGLYVPNGGEFFFVKETENGF